MMNLKMTIRRASTDDIHLINRLARDIFPATYRHIISDEQIEYMMEWMYSEESLRRQMSEEGHVYLIGESTAGEGELQEKRPFGYVSIEQQGADLFHLQKIYVLPNCQGSGAGRYLFQSAIGFIKTVHPTPCVMELNVNRYNPALGFYQHMGMKVARQGDFDIGNGYFMNDYIMSIQL